MTTCGRKSASKHGQVRCRAIPTQAVRQPWQKVFLRHYPSATMILLYAASRDPRRGETPVMCASTVQVAAPPGEVVSNTGKQNRKVLATPVMESFASITGVTTLSPQERPPPTLFAFDFLSPLFSLNFNAFFWTVPMLCAAEMVSYIRYFRL